MPRLAQAQTATRRTIDASNFEDVEIAWEWMSVENFVSRSTAGGSEWWAPLDTIVEALVEDTPDLHRPGHLPFTDSHSRLTDSVEVMSWTRSCQEQREKPCSNS